MKRDRHDDMLSLVGQVGALSPTKGMIGPMEVFEIVKRVLQEQDAKREFLVAAHSDGRLHIEGTSISHWGLFAV